VQKKILKKQNSSAKQNYDIEVISLVCGYTLE